MVVDRPVVCFDILSPSCIGYVMCCRSFFCFGVLFVDEWWGDGGGGPFALDEFQGSIYLFVGEEGVRGGRCVRCATTSLLGSKAFLSSVRRPARRDRGF